MESVMKSRLMQLVLLLFATTAASLNGCPPGQIPVSVLEAEVKCVVARPCSGVYGVNGMEPVGLCPSGDACALLPNNHIVMGCVAAGRTDVTYVLPNGSLAPGPYTPPPITSPVAPTTNTPSPSTTGSHIGSGSRASRGSGSGSRGSTNKSSSKSSGKSSGTGSGTGSGKSSGSLNDPQTAKGPNGINPDKINGPGKQSNDANNKSSSLSLTSILLIVIGCLAVVAVVAGVRLLHKRKEPVAANAAAAGADYDGGAECVTPKERVLLL